MSLENPVFIVGTGRCGSTLFHDVLTEHPGMGWLSSVIDRKPRKPEKNKWVNYLASIPWIGRYVKRAYRPSEPYRFWETYCHGFATPYRDLTADDVLPAVIPKIRDRLSRAIPENRRLLVKITGWPRIGYLKKIFPDARFIHVVRDGRAVVNSVLAAPYFDGWSGPHNWTRGSMDERQKRIWKESGESFVVLAAIGWENRMRAFSEASKHLSEDDYLEVRYESLCDNPLKEFERTLRFIGEDIQGSQLFFDQVANTLISSKNEKWKQDLTKKQQQDLEKALKEVLAECPYV